MVESPRKAVRKPAAQRRTDSGPTVVLCGIDGLAARSPKETLVDSRKPFDWESLRGRNVRIIDDNLDRLERHIRAAAALDCRIDYLDAWNVDYAIVTYDTGPHRALKKKHGIPILPPMAHRMPPLYALSLLKEYQNAGAQPR